jgi:glutamate transport system permease protein
VDAVFDNLDVYVSGFWITLQLSVVSFVAAMVIGTIVATARVSPVPPARWAGLAYVETIRNIPLLVLLVLFFYGLTKVGLQYSPFVSAVIVIAGYHATFISEAIRSGINSVAVGQAEAARSIGLTFGQTLRLVVLPQAFRTVVPPIGNIFIALVKNSSLASIIAVKDLSQEADLLNTATAEPIAVYIGAAMAYLIITLPSGLAVGAIERKVAIRR